MHILTSILEGKPINNALIGRAAVETEVIQATGGRGVLLGCLDQIAKRHYAALEQSSQDLEVTES